MGVSYPKADVPKKVLNNWDYEVCYPSYPPSEQAVVLEVTRRLAQKKDITQDHLLAFKTVYPRLYQVPPKSRRRLVEWMEQHPYSQNWNLGRFLNTADEDRALGFEPRKPGVPSEAIWKSAYDREKYERIKQERQPQAPNPVGELDEAGEAEVAAYDLEPQAGAVEAAATNFDLDNHHLDLANEAMEQLQRPKKDKMVPAVRKRARSRVVTAKMTPTPFPNHLKHKFPSLTGLSQQEFFSEELIAASASFQELQKKLERIVERLDPQDEFGYLLSQIADDASAHIARLKQAEVKSSRLKHEMGGFTLEDEDPEVRRDVLAKRAKIAREELPRTEHTMQPRQGSKTDLPELTRKGLKQHECQQLPSQPQHGVTFEYGGPDNSFVGGSTMDRPIHPEYLVATQSAPSVISDSSFRMRGRADPDAVDELDDGEFLPLPSRSVPRSEAPSRPTIRHLGDVDLTDPQDLERRYSDENFSRLVGKQLQREQKSKKEHSTASTKKSTGGFKVYTPPTTKAAVPATTSTLAPNKVAKTIQKTKQSSQPPAAAAAPTGSTTCAMSAALAQEGEKKGKNQPGYHGLDAISGSDE
ncbi:hypothetical protein QBC35DRAFT_552389 [Podospora australis]|uniref:Uncharacterized protein n=1 Tax=Podospora australis TaxID=1536484 RepID=A0AAN6WSA3_9PEZI|nr:hypothetical protein QBC35DRAFT_552389 [Podospora australis]